MADENVSLAGGIYAKTDGVSAIAADQIADYEGEAALSITTEHVVWKGQNLVTRDSVLIGISASMNFGTVLWKASSFGTMFGITATSGSTKEASPADGTVYTLDNTLSTVPELEWLSSMTRSSDDKKFQICGYAGRVAGDFPVSFTHGTYMTQDVAIALYADADGKIIEFITES